MLVRRVGFLLTMVVALGGGTAVALPRPMSADEARFAGFLADLPARATPGARAAAVGEALLGRPYVANPLMGAVGAGRAEPLTARLDGFDCVTLVETCLAVARAQERARTWQAFTEELERLRYRDGQRAGYTSRLHYFSDWLRDNDRRATVRNLTADLGGVRDTRPLTFMTRHRSAYPALADEAVFTGLRLAEAAASRQPRHVIPKAHIPAVLPLLQPGDVLAFATDIEGLDVAHVGLAHRTPEGAVHVLHAPAPGQPVQISRAPLVTYTARHARHVGLMVGRLLPVKVSLPAAGIFGQG
ncbi:MAG: N-acetylmuramoyl-L-alanine amidase-like domain-containing protein [Candidatus Sericytochromatia bacterium]|nr:N-acetylmuramoyl-L-alanine amidase-like domain-containing protein [Candidatus Sericytochromatia bacterium]